MPEDKTPLQDIGDIRERESKLMSQRHPLTCGGDRGDQAHREYQAIHGGDLGELVQSESGLACPVCEWKQPEPLHVSQAAEITRLTTGISQLTEIIEGMLSGNGHDPQEIEHIRATYPLAFELLIGNGLLP